MSSSTAVISLAAVLWLSRLMMKYSPARVVPAGFGVSGAALLATWALSFAAPSLAAGALYLYTALFGAVIRDGRQLVEYLIAQGVPLAHRNKTGQTALDLANGSNLGITFHVYPELADVIRKAMIAQGLPITESKTAEAR